MVVNVYTDGSARKKDVWIGAYSFRVEHNNETHEEAHTLIPATNNVAELVAVINAMYYCGQHYPSEQIIIHTDSNYVINGDKRPLDTNVDYWNIYRTIKDQLHVTITKVKAHANNKGNNRVDSLAREELRKNFIC